MRRRPFPAERERLRGLLLRRLDAAAAWLNPFLMVIATMLFIMDLSVGVALVVARMPVTHVAVPPPPSVTPAGVAVAPMAVQ